MSDRFTETFELSVNRLLSDRTTHKCVLSRDTLPLPLHFPYALPPNSCPEQGLSRFGPEPPPYRLLRIGEDNVDRGSRPNSRINKSWPYKNKQASGLVNNGSVCFMNAAIQCLLHVPAFHNYLREVLAGEHPEVGFTLTYDLAVLQQDLFDIFSKSLTPMGVGAWISKINKCMSLTLMQDAHEFMSSLLDCIQGETILRGQSLRSSIVFEIFGGTMEQRITCMTCKFDSITEQDFYDISVPFSSKQRLQRLGYTLEGSVDEFFSSSEIQLDDNGHGGYQCRKCDRRCCATSSTTILDPSEYLCINLKRFIFDSTSHKNQEHLAYPIELDLTQYAKDQTLPLKYRLISIMVHSGYGTESGHYVSYCQLANKRWGKFNDDNLCNVPVQTVLSQNDSVYFLVYARLTPVETGHVSSEDIRLSINPLHFSNMDEGDLLTNLPVHLYPPKPRVPRRMVDISSTYESAFPSLGSAYSSSATLVGVNSPAVLPALTPTQTQSDPVLPLSVIEALSQDNDDAKVLISVSQDQDDSTAFSRPSSLSQNTEISISSSQETNPFVDASEEPLIQIDSNESTVVFVEPPEQCVGAFALLTPDSFEALKDTEAPQDNESILSADLPTPPESPKTYDDDDDCAHLLSEDPSPRVSNSILRRVNLLFSKSSKPKSSSKKSKRPASQDPFYEELESLRPSNKPAASNLFGLGKIAGMFKKSDKNKGRTKWTDRDADAPLLCRRDSF